MADQPLNEQTAYAPDSPDVYPDPLLEGHAAEQQDMQPREEEPEDDDEDEVEDVTPQIPNHLLPPNKRVILDQERFLPIANISRIMKRLLPSSGKVAKEAKECIQECVSEFISFLTGEACERCRQEKRKTISADDLMKSLINMGFDDYVESMELFMRKYREVNRLAQRPSYIAPTHNTFTATALPPTAVISQPITLTLPTGTVTSSAPIVQVAASSSMPVQVAAAPQVFTTVAPPTQNPAQAFAMVAAGPSTSSSDGSTAPNILEPIQLMVDPMTNQHYMVVDNADGTRELRPVQLVTGDMVPYDGPSTSSAPQQFAIQTAQPELAQPEKEPTFVAPGPVKTTSRPPKPSSGPYPKSSRQH